MCPFTGLQSTNLFCSISYHQKLEDSEQRKRELILALDECKPTLVEKLKNMKLSTQQFKSKVEEVANTIHDSTQ